MSVAQTTNTGANKASIIEYLENNKMPYEGSLHLTANTNSRVKLSDQPYLAPLRLNTEEIVLTNILISKEMEALST